MKSSNYIVCNAMIETTSIQLLSQLSECVGICAARRYFQFIFYPLKSLQFSPTWSRRFL